MEGLERIVSEHRLFHGLGPEFVALATGCAKDVRLDTDQYLFHAEDAADWIYLIRHGRVALEMATPGRGAVQYETLGEGEVVGLPWLLPPYRWGDDARAIELVRAIAIDAKCLRDKCKADHDPSYEILKRFLPVLVQWLARVARRVRDLPDTWTLDLVSPDGVPLMRYAPGQFTMTYVFGVGEIPVSISGDASDATPLVQTVRAVGKVSEAVTRLSVGDTLGIRGSFGTALQSELGTAVAVGARGGERGGARDT